MAPKVDCGFPLTEGSAGEREKREMGHFVFLGGILLLQPSLYCRT